MMKPERLNGQRDTLIEVKKRQERGVRWKFCQGETEKEGIIGTVNE